MKLSKRVQALVDVIGVGNIDTTLVSDIAALEEELSYKDDDTLLRIAEEHRSLKERNTKLVETLRDIRAMCDIGFNLPTNANFRRIGHKASKAVSQDTSVGGVK